jgi:hypothetical protein
MHAQERLTAPAPAAPPLPEAAVEPTWTRDLPWPSSGWPHAAAAAVSHGAASAQTKTSGREEARTCGGSSLPGRFHPQFRDKNRRDVGKSQSKWTASKTETPGSHPLAAAGRLALHPLHLLLGRGASAALPRRAPPAVSTGAAEYDGIDHHQSRLRFTYASTFLQSHYLPPHPSEAAGQPTCRDA